MSLSSFIAGGNKDTNKVHGGGEVTVTNISGDLVKAALTEIEWKQEKHDMTFGDPKHYNRIRTIRKKVATDGMFSKEEIAEVKKISIEMRVKTTGKVTPLKPPLKAPELKEVKEDIVFIPVPKNETSPIHEVYVEATKEIPDQTIKLDFGKLRYDLIPPECIRELAKVYTFGANKYTANSWQGVSIERYKASLLRHVYAYLEGEMVNEEDGGVATLMQVAWNAFSLFWLENKEE